MSGTEVYAIYKVHFGEGHTIVEKALVYRVNASGRMANLHEVNRDNIIIAIEVFGEKFITIIDMGDQEYDRGPEIRVAETSNGKFVRIDDRVIEKDDFGEISEY